MRNGKPLSLRMRLYVPGVITQNHREVVGLALIIAGRYNLKNPEQVRLPDPSVYLDSSKNEKLLTILVVSAHQMPNINQKVNRSLCAFLVIEHIDKQKNLLEQQPQLMLPGIRRMAAMNMLISLSLKSLFNSLEFAMIEDDNIGYSWNLQGITTREQISTIRAEKESPCVCTRSEFNPKKTYPITHLILPPKNRDFILENSLFLTVLQLT